MQKSMDEVAACHARATRTAFSRDDPFSIVLRALQLLWGNISAGHSR